MRRFRPPLSTSKAIKLSDLEAMKSKSKTQRKKKVVKKETQTILEAELENKSVVSLIQMYQQLYNQYQKSVDEKNDLEATRLKIIDEISKIKQETSEMECQIPATPYEKDLHTPRSRGTGTKMYKIASTPRFKDNSFDLTLI